MSSRKNPYGGLRANPRGRTGQFPAKGFVNGRRPLDMAPAGVVHRTRGVGGFSFTGQPSDGDTVTVTNGLGESVTFEFESGGGVAAGNVSVTIGGSTVDTADNLNGAMFGTVTNIGFQPIRLTALGGAEQVYLTTAGEDGCGGSFSESATNVAVDQLHGDVDHGSPQILAMSRVPTAQELVQGWMLFACDFSIRGHNLSIRVTSTNTLKAFDGKSNSSNFFAAVVVDNNGATFPFLATDTVSVLAWGENIAYEDKVVFD